ncbi:MAG: histidine phosphatase family protein [Rhodothermales bacterium]
MRATTLHLVRHGQTDYNKNRIVQGRGINSDLNAVGQQQGEALAQRFAEARLDAIYSSTLNRAIQTADRVAAHHPDVPRYQLRDLEEMSWGVYEGQPSSEAMRVVFERFYEQWESGTFDERIEGGESIFDVQVRAMAALQHITQAHPGETVLVVSHGRMLRVLLASVLADYGLERMHDIAHANTGVNTVRYADGLYTAEVLNDTSHLDAVELIMVE